MLRPHGPHLGYPASIDAVDGILQFLLVGELVLLAPAALPALQLRRRGQRPRGEDGRVRRGRRDRESLEESGAP